MHTQVAAQLQRQTLDLREEAELAKRSLNVIVKNLKMEEGENSEKLARAFEREILDRMGLTGEIELVAHRLPRARGKAGPPPLLLTFETPADKISFLRRRKRLEKTLFTLDDRRLDPGAATTATGAMADLPPAPADQGGPAGVLEGGGHLRRPQALAGDPRGPSDSRRPSLGEYSSSSVE
eukprot:jgi/Mesvir1/21999/Mv11641-RA.1